MMLNFHWCSHPVRFLTSSVTLAFVRPAVSARVGPDACPSARQKAAARMRVRRIMEHAVALVLSIGAMLARRHPGSRDRGLAICGRAPRRCCSTSGSAARMWSEQDQRTLIEALRLGCVGAHNPEVERSDAAESERPTSCAELLVVRGSVPGREQPPVCLRPARQDQETVERAS
jgi:hypothetical protein